MLVLGIFGGCGRIGFDALSNDGQLGGRADAGADVDAGQGSPSDASADVSARQTWSFGEVPGATVRDVTADTLFCDGGDRDLNWGAFERFEGSDDCTGLLRFDVSALPAGARVVDASLEIWPELVPTERGRVDVHRVLEAWIEGSGRGDPGEANFELRMPGLAWSSPGALPPGSADSVALHGFDPVRYEAQVIPLPAAVVQGWLDEPGSNHGLAFFGTGYGSNDTKHPHFLSREATEANQRPLLRVTFDPP